MFADALLLATLQIFSQVPVEDFNAANQARYLKDIRDAGITTVLVSYSDYYGIGDSRKPYFAKIGREVRYFEEAGLDVRVWCNGFGYGNDRRVGAGKTRFANSQNIVSMHGKTSGALCPLDPAMRRLLIENMRDTAATGVKATLMDDDFIQSARGFVGCACDRHLARVAKKVGHPVTHADMVRAFTGKPNALRTAFVDVTGEVAVELARELRAAVDEVNPQTRIGLCLSVTHWDLEGVDMDELLRAFAGETRPFVRISGAPYWDDARFRGIGLEGVTEFARMQAQWLQGKGYEIFDENDPYPRKVKVVPAWRCELYDKATIADGLMARHKYMLCYGKDRTEPGYIEAHLANMKDDRKLAELFEGAEPYGLRIDFPKRRIREATLPAEPLEERRITELYSQPLAANLLLRCGIPIRHDDATASYVFRPEDFGIDVAAVDFAAFKGGDLRKRILEDVRRKSGRPLDVYVETASPRIYQIVRYNAKRSEYAVLLENMGMKSAEVKIVTAGTPRITGSVRGKFTTGPGGVTLADLPAHEFAAVRFALNDETGK